MANNWSHNTTFEEVVQLLEQDESYRRTFGLPLNNETTRTSPSEMFSYLFVHLIYL